MASPSDSKAFLETEGKERIPCLFNPAELSLQLRNSWASDPMPGGVTPTLRYTGAGTGMLRLTLFFDTTDTGSAVTTYTAKLVGLLEVDSKLPGTKASSNNARPQWVVFHWGDFHSFKAVVASVDLTFEYFSSSGTPLRARAGLVLAQYQEDMAFGPQNPTSGTPRPHRVHRVQPGETLDRIAALHLGDATSWRVIAQANGVEDPLSVKPGTLLAIPGSA
ncbi:LysM peptidoglycan-binding domain-containing protein [Ferrimicrobium sp.]|uniref:CIS tube protein n=1 Tax=Ferrimicrobium sp. TaxID=2926050 RepID=UPI00260E3297|nr:LysM peptidoglycan-binding domain-containing protein [Ferrimicrobium sp.]